MRTRFQALIAILFLVSFTALAAEPPNVLLILSDDHSAAHVGYYVEQQLRDNLEECVVLQRDYVPLPGGITPRNRGLRATPAQ